MAKDQRSLLEVLNAEMQFLEEGGYGRWSPEPWRSRLIFEDSPTCLNYYAKRHHAPCIDCVLMQLVPQKVEAEKAPCRQIPLNAAGETLDSLYRYAGTRETERIFWIWLRDMIQRLEHKTRTETKEGADMCDTPPNTCAQAPAR